MISRVEKQDEICIGGSPCLGWHQGISNSSVSFYIEIWNLISIIKLKDDDDDTMVVTTNIHIEL